MSERVFIGLGANVGDREANIKRALELLSASGKVTIRRVSTLKETRPVGVTDQPLFINGAAEITCQLGPGELLKLLKAVEKEVGRKRRERWGPREIDLDLLYYGGDIINEEELIIPHQEISRRRFVLDSLV